MSKCENYSEGICYLLAGECIFKATDKAYPPKVKCPYKDTELCWKKVREKSEGV